jgi:hypothetical protein
MGDDPGSPLAWLGVVGVAEACLMLRDENFHTPGGVVRIGAGNLLLFGSIRLISFPSARFFSPVVLSMIVAFAIVVTACVYGRRTNAKPAHRSAGGGGTPTSE